ncbi:MAG: hypothetical protein ACO3P9_12885, partial [Phycisphaerales bacterium]
MTASSYSMNATAPGRTTTSLSFASASNGSFNPSYVAGSFTGDIVAGDGTSGSGWSLEAVGADYAPVFSSPTPINVVGSVLQIASAASDFAIGDSMSSTFQLVFSDEQTYFGLNDFGSIDLSGLSSMTATLTRSGSPATDLLTTALGTRFAAGTYTLSLSGTLGSAASGVSNVSLYAVFAAPVPSTGIAALLGASIVP